MPICCVAKQIGMVQGKASASCRSIRDRVCARAHRLRTGGCAIDFPPKREKDATYSTSFPLPPLNLANNSIFGTV